MFLKALLKVFTMSSVGMKVDFLCERVADTGVKCWRAWLRERHDLQDLKICLQSTLSGTLSVGDC